MSQKRREQRAKSSSKRVEIERLSTPDQLDQVIQVARFPHWLALGALAVVLATALVASTTIAVPVKVRGEGILINVGGILNVTSDTEGRLLELLVRPGDAVDEGQLVARVDQPQLRRQLRDREARLVEARGRRQTVEAFQRRITDTQHRTIANQRRALEQRYEFARRRLTLLQEQLEGEIRLQEQGIISRRQLTETSTEINEAKSELTSLDNEIQRFLEIVTAQELEHERELLELQIEISELERQVAGLGEELRRSSEVASPYTGRVIELMVNRGEIVDRNGALFSLLPATTTAAAVPTALGGGASLRPAEAPEPAQGELVAVLYVPPAEGKKIRQGMEVQVAPTSIKREEYGFMLGSVEAVAEVPSTTEGMMRILKNQQLVHQLSQDHAPFEVLVRLQTDSSTTTGYRWSSSSGPEVEINVGTLCGGDVITERERPILLLLPALGRLFRG